MSAAMVLWLTFLFLMACGRRTPIQELDPAHANARGKQVLARLMAYDSIRVNRLILEINGLEL